MQANVSKSEKVDQELPRKIKNHFYVDDLNPGVYSTEEVYEFYKKMKVRFLKANFNVRKRQNERRRFV